MPKWQDIVLVDFQLINYGHPAYDILYLLYLSSDLGKSRIFSQQAKLKGRVFFALTPPSELFMAR